MGPPPLSTIIKGRGGGGGRTFQKLNYLGGEVSKFIARKGDKPESGWERGVDLKMGEERCHFFITLTLIKEK